MSQSQQEISANLVIFLEKVKQKQIKDYPLVELSAIIDMVDIFYRKTNLKEEKKLLKNVYAKIVDWFNEEAYKLNGLKQTYKKELI